MKITFNIFNIFNIFMCGKIKMLFFPAYKNRNC